MQDSKYFTVRFNRQSGHTAEITVSKKEHRNTVFTVLSSGGKIISNKKVKPSAGNSVEGSPNS